MKRKFAITFLILGILLIISGITLLTVSYINEENKDKKDTENTILTNYTVFKNNIESFNEYRSGTYFDKVATDLFVESVEEDYNEWIETLNEYTVLIDNIDNSSTDLKELCVNTYYSNEELRNKCDAFVIAYETAINYYVKDIDSFNETINEYLSEYGNEDIKLYELKYKYVDIDSNGEFSGK